MGWEGHRRGRQSWRRREWRGGWCRRCKWCWGWFWRGVSRAISQTLQHSHLAAASERLHQAFTCALSEYIEKVKDSLCKTAQIKQALWGHVCAAARGLCNSLEWPTCFDEGNWSAFSGSATKCRTFSTCRSWTLAITHSFFGLFYFLTKKLESEKTSAIQDVIPGLCKLERDIASCACMPTPYIESYLNCFVNRFGFVSTDMHLVSATVLSPHGLKWLKIAATKNTKLQFAQHTWFLQ